MNPNKPPFIPTKKIQKPPPSRSSDQTSPSGTKPTSPTSSDPPKTEKSCSATSLPQLPGRPTCKACDLHKNANVIGMASVWFKDSLPPGPHPAVVFIGSHPTVQEERVGEPFSSPSGQLVRKVYTQSPFKKGEPLTKRASIYFTNAVRCNPMGEDIEGPHLRACKEHLDADLAELRRIHSEVHPVFMGAYAIKQSLNTSLKNAIRGNPHQL